MIGERNDQVILAAAQSADRIIAAWGARPHPRDARPAEVFELLSMSGRAVEALDLTRLGQPRHPTRAQWDALPLPYRGPPQPGNEMPIA
jgi:hypothetical protein